MPQAANLTINNAAAVAKTFTLLNPASGIGSSAHWELKEGSHAAIFPKLSAVCRPDTSAPKSRPGTSSVVKLKMPQPVTNTTTGITSVGEVAEFVATVKMPEAFPENLKDDFVAYCANAVALAVMKEFMKGRSSFT